MTVLNIFAIDLNNNERCFLFYLYFYGPQVLFVQELANALGVSKRTMVKIIKKMLGLGYINRDYVPNGRSSYTLVLAL